MRTRVIAGDVAFVVIAAIVATVLYFTVGSKDPHGGQSDEDQIRAVVAGMQAAYNSSDSDGWKKSFCEGDQQNQADLDKYSFGAKNDPNGRAAATVEYVQLHGDTATVHIDVKYAKGKNEADHWTFVRKNDDWKACPSKSH